MNTPVKQNAYHIAFVFDQPQPGVISIPAYTEDEAKQKLIELLDGFNNVKINKVTNLEDVPMFKAMYDQSSREDIDDIEIIEAKPNDNMKKPN